MADRNIEDYQKRSEQLKEKYSSWKEHYITLSEYQCVRKTRFLQNPNSTGSADDGARKDQNIANSAPLQAIRDGSAGLHSGLTPQATPFFQCVISDEDLMKEADVSAWLYDVTQKVLLNYSLNNFYQSKKAYWRSSLVFGIAVSLQLESDFRKSNKGVSTFYNYETGEYMLARGASGTIDSCYRKYRMTANQMVEEFGEENCSNAVQEAVKNKNGETDFLVHHIIQPNNFFNPKGAGPELHQYESVYYEDAETADNKFLREEGFRTKPFSAMCWDPDGNLPYGNSPGMMALGDCMMLQALEQMKMEGIDRLVRPHLQAPSELEDKGVNLEPDGITFIDMSQGRRSYIEPIEKVALPLDAVANEIQIIIQRIQNWFFNPLFVSLLNDTRSNPTAYQISEEQREKLLMLGPITETAMIALRDDVLRTIDILDDTGQLPPPPPSLYGKQLDIQILGRIAQAQRSVGISSIKELFAATAEIDQLYPGTRFELNAKEAIRELHQKLGVSPRIMQNEIIAKELMAYNRKQEAELQQMKMAQEGAKAAKDLGSIPAENTMLSAMAQQNGEGGMG